MTIGDDLGTSLRELLGDFGQPMTIQRSTPGAYDPTSGNTGAPTIAVYSGVGRLGNYRDAVVDGTIIQQNDRRVTWQPDEECADFIPRIGDQVIVTGEPAGVPPFAVMDLDPRQVAGVWIGFTLQVRR